jgi:hypothetical protein
MVEPRDDSLLSVSGLRNEKLGFDYRPNQVSNGDNNDYQLNIGFRYGN